MSILRFVVKGSVLGERPCPLYCRGARRRTVASENSLRALVTQSASKYITAREIST